MYSISSAFVFLPGEIGIRLAEARLGERGHHRGAGERLGQENHVGVDKAHLPDQPLPELERLRVRVVDPERLHPEPDPVQDDVAQSGPQPLPVGTVEVDVVDVLVALRRVLGVLERAVRPAVEPLGVLLQPWMVG